MLSYGLSLVFWNLTHLVLRWEVRVLETSWVGCRGSAMVGCGVKDGHSSKSKSEISALASQSLLSRREVGKCEKMMHSLE